MKPGIYHDLSNDKYHAAAGISKSGLDLIARSPYLYRHRQVVEQTKAMLIGSAVHCAVLEPATFPHRYTVAPSADGRTKAGKELLARFAEDNAGKTILPAGDYDQVVAMANATWRHPAARNILTGGQAEMSIFKDHHGALCKVRPDWITEDLLVDVKTTQDASPDAFSKACWNYRYHVQAALYLDVANAAMADRFSSFVFIAIEKPAPFQVAVYVADAAMVEAGRVVYHRDLATYRKCVETDTWPGINEGKIASIGLPYWAASKVEILTDG
jgi:exodeoxyribonuclease VIII